MGLFSKGKKNMGKRRKLSMEFRYCEMPGRSPVLALLGDKGIQICKNNTDSLHFHNHLEIGYCYEGQGELVLGEQSLRFRADQFTIIPKNYPHMISADPGTVSHWEYLFIDEESLFGECYRKHLVKAEHMSARINSCAVLNSLSESPIIAGMIRQLLDITREPKDFYIEEAKGISLALLINIVRENQIRDQEENEVLEGKIPIPISQALDYITCHYMEPLKVEKLAAQCNMSESHFRRTFSSYMKISPLEYINLVRVHTACEYLKKTDIPVSDIAYKCGFITLSTFNRNFRHIMGNAPCEWRKRPENFEQQLLKFQIHWAAGWSGKIS